MRMRLLTYFTVLFLLSLPQYGAAAGSIDLQKFATRFIKAEDQAWQQGNFTALQAIEDPNITFHGLDVKGWKAHKQYIMNARQNVPGIEQEWHYLTGDGDLFALSYKAVWINMNSSSLHE